MLNPHTRFARFAVAGLAILLLGVGACSTETTTEVEVGKKVSVGLSGKLEILAGGPDGAKTIDINQRIQEVVQLFSQTSGIEEVNVNIEQSGEGDLSLSLMLFGDDLDGEVLTAMVRESFPEMPNAEVHIENLEGTITESWASRFGREIFHIEADGATDEEIRAQVLQQLADQGFEGDAEVNVVTEGDQQSIEIKMTEEEIFDQ